MLLHHFLFSSVKQLFLQGMSIVLARRFLTVDRETVGEIFRIHTKKNSRHEKTAKTQSSNRFFARAGNVTRTRDLLITNQLLYQLSYSGTSINKFAQLVYHFF